MIVVQRVVVYSSEPFAALRPLCLCERKKWLRLCCARNVLVSVPTIDVMVFKREEPLNREWLALNLQQGIGQEVYRA